MGNVPSSVSTTDVLVCSVALALSFYLKNRRTLPYPPGPKGLPIIGNVMDVPEKQPWVTYTDMGRSVGSPMIHLNMMGTHMVIINDLKTIGDIFDKRAHRYGDRPRMPMLNEVGGFSWNFGFGGYNERWKACRRQFDSYFKESEARKLRPREVAITHKLLRRILDAPDKFSEHFRFHAGVIILDIGYGILPERADDPFITAAENGLKAVNRAGDANIVDVMPWIQHLPGWLPGMGWKAKTVDWKKWAREMRDVPFDAVKQAIQNNTARTSVASQLLEEAGNDPAKEDIIRSTVGTMFSAGTDTTVSTLNAFVACMIAWPEVQKTAQAELDRVVGKDRLPDFSDQPRLPFIQAICKEMLRYQCPVPLALPHLAMEDDIWTHEGKQYLIPKGAIVFGNTWALCRDPEVYPDPDTFDPRRFLTKDGQLNPQVPDPEPVAFGYRPRHCPGRWMAEDTLYLSIASLLAVFNFETVDRQPFTTEYEKIFNPGLVMYPYPFKAKISPRSKASADLVRNADFHA